MLRSKFLVWEVGLRRFAEDSGKAIPIRTDHNQTDGEMIWFIIKQFSIEKEGGNHPCMENVARPEAFTDFLVEWIHKNRHA